jgi:DNA polymerase-3 subunit gamma/tau
MAGQSLDVIEIDGASNRGIDDMRQINETVGYAPSLGRYKIYIIDEVHMLTKEAFNALLKTLEEPPERAKFFFATTEPHKILPTIISRCQRFDLGRILPAQITAKLEQIAKDLNRSAEPDALHQIAILSDGSLRDAESLFDQILCFLDGTVTADAVRKVFGLVAEEHFFALDIAFSEGRPAYAFELVDHLFQTGKDLSHFLSQLIEHYRLITISKTLGGPAPAHYAASAHLYTPAQSLYILEYLLKAESDLQKSLSGRVFLEATLLHIIRSKNRIPVEMLIRRLTELEASFSTIPQIQTEKPAAVLPPPPAKVELPAPIAAPPPPKKELPPQILDEKHPSHYDTLLRFTAVELEGSVKTT